MNRNFFAAAALLAVSLGAAAQDEVIILDLTRSDSPLTFNETNGAWTETYNNSDETHVRAQVFDFEKWGFAAYGMWWGFTPSVSTDNSRKEDTITYQFSNMAKGGILLGEDGAVRRDEFGDPVVSGDVPYLIGYYADFMSEHPCAMSFAGGEAYEPVGVYVNLTSYTYYTVVDGDAYARAFRNGDELTLRVVGHAADGTTRSVEVPLAWAGNGDMAAARGWKYVDLSELGAVDALWFEMETTDMGQFGANTPLYFALDKLSVKAKGTGAVGELPAESSARAKAYGLNGVEAAADSRGILVVDGRKVLRK